jgi:hypothetical protein
MKNRAYELWPNDTPEHQQLRGAFYQGGWEQGFPMAEFEAIKFKDLKPGDRVILKFKGKLPLRAAERLNECLRDFFPEGVKVAVIADGDDVDIRIEREP